VVGAAAAGDELGETLGLAREDLELAARLRLEAQEGRARLEDLEPGRWSVTVRTFGRMISEREDGESTQEVVVEAGKTASLRFDL